MTFTPTKSKVKAKILYLNSSLRVYLARICKKVPHMVSETYLVDVCDEVGDKYRFGYNGQEKDNEWAGIGNFNEFEFREQDTRIARFLSLDPLSKKFPWWTPYQFAGNTPIMAKDLEGAEIFIPQIPIAIPRPIITVPRTGTLPLPQVPGEVVLPPISIDIPEGITVGQPQTTTAGEAIRRIERADGIDWSNNPPFGPEGLGSDWEDVTHPDNKGDGKDFHNKKTGEKIRFDKGREGRPGWEGSDHWHRYNPNKTGKKDYYLDKDGTPVPKGSNASHIKPGNMTILDNIIIIGKRPERNWFQRNITDPIKNWRRERKEKRLEQQRKEYEEWMKPFRA